MNRLVALVAALATTGSLYVTSAEAGCGGGYGFYRSYHRSVARISKPRIARKKTTTSVAVVAKPEPANVAEAETKTTDTTVAVSTAPVTEKASTTPAAKIADAKPADAKATEKVASAAKECKQFFASAGITLSVPCEK